MNDRELMKLALEALDWAADCIEPRKPHNCDCPVCVASDALLQRLADNTIHSCSYYCERPDCVRAQRDELRERLAQPETVMAEYKFQTYAAYKTDGEMKIGVVPEQEPVAWVTGWHDGHCVIRAANPSAILPIGIALYTTPPRREWVGLTLEEIFDCTAHITRIQKDDWVATDSDLAEFAHVIEAKLKEKNS